MAGIEPATSAWKAEVLPLNYIRNVYIGICNYLIYQRSRICQNHFIKINNLKLAVALIHFDAI